MTRINLDSLALKLKLQELKEEQELERKLLQENDRPQTLAEQDQEAWLRAMQRLGRVI